MALVASLAVLAAAGCSGAAPVKLALGAGSQGSGNSEGGGGPLAPVRSSKPGGGGHPAGGGAQSAVSNGVLFGGDLPLVAQQAKLGRKLAIVRVYDIIGERFLNPELAQVMSSGTTVLASLDTFPPSGPSYASIAAGHEDAAIRTWLTSVEQAAVTYRLSAIYVTFEHEANDPGHHTGLGSPADFVRAWDHIHQIATSAHLDWNQGGRLHWVEILTHNGWNPGTAASFWPGPGEVDVVAADGYNTGGCRIARRNKDPFTFGQTPPVSPASLFSNAIGFAATHGGLPVFIAEWGSVPYTSPSVRVNFIQQMQAYIQANPSIAAALYWDSQVPPCNYILDNSPTSFAALTSMAHAAVLQGHLATN